MDSQELLERAFSRASKIEKRGTVPFDTVKKTDIAKVTAIGDMTVSTLLKYVRAFPRLEKSEEFLPELIDVLVGLDDLKKALSNLTWAAEKVSDLQRTYLRRIRRAANIDQVEKERKGFYGRFSSIMKQIDGSLKVAAKARDKFRELPSIDPDMPTIVIAGYPNVGKSQLMERISTGKPVIAPYPFTTKGIGVGHFQEGWRRFQIVDTPGLLDRDLEERNAIELQAVLALKYLADLIIFVIDPSETCGYSLDKQIHLLEATKGLFDEIPLIEVENKADICVSDSGRLKISAASGEGVDQLLEEAVTVLKARSKEEGEERSS